MDVHIPIVYDNPRCCSPPAGWASNWFDPGGDEAAHVIHPPLSKLSVTTYASRLTARILSGCLGLRQPLSALRSDWKVMEQGRFKACYRSRFKLEMKEMRDMEVDLVSMKHRNSNAAPPLPPSLNTVQPSMATFLNILSFSAIPSRTSKTEPTRTDQLKEHRPSLPPRLQLLMNLIHQLLSPSTIHLFSARLFQVWAPKDACTSSPPPDITTHSSLLFIPQPES
ncbi:hypothetical protein ONZ45_g11137 [Pleurotus djamor]|nr:hypothetical protein ONZ45_g11137 [Pleurotus djamor]